MTEFYLWKMKAVIQRVKSAKIYIDRKVYSKINDGLLVFIGIMKNDKDWYADFLAKKITDLRIFGDENDKMNLSVKDIGGEIMVISQFTLCTDKKKSGNRPSFFNAEEPSKAKVLYEKFIAYCGTYYGEEKIKQGVFAAKMEIYLINDGPVTILLEENGKE